MKSIFWTLLLVGSLGLAPAALLADTTIDDPKLDRLVAEARREFLTTQSFDRLDVVVLLPRGDGTWQRGSYGRETLAYPASCVKLAYMVAAVHWCSAQGKPVDCLDSHLRPMVVDSSNEETGEVVDAITGAPNRPATSSNTPGYREWYSRRLYTENFLKAQNLLGNQTILHKTYPSNSGEMPGGAEKVAIDERGRNAMRPDLSAELMRRIVRGELEPQATAYMRALLATPTFDEQSGIGFGLPPGSRYENKIGAAYDTLEDIAYIVLPNGRELILAIFTNGLDQRQPEPYDIAPLGVFAEKLIEKLGLDEGDPPKRKIDDTDSAVTVTGRWQKRTDTKDKFGEDYLRSVGGFGSQQVIWNLNVPESGRYEVAVWYPALQENTSEAAYTVVHGDGIAEVKLNQQVWGGRWVKLGDFAFKAGQGSVILSDKTADPNRQVVADALKITRWPR
ncbi:serine hydrolase [Gloeobacter kilaueensis]|uniref:Beta-lactamase n=1 Tax=Gloeobacter kilaueensis (strain ATCC BAA-2537 / CCAP 1431/1 / ULC 316 / JS1) TaxID=1183438 RepID=U5QL61_GLOK1|nr:serine hydrolase [Gloeobacter kilaueensis]AGY59623.1 hypothetical protein GKIL_3377 [Gloeobacter kilaueensis JS1]